MKTLWYLASPISHASEIVVHDRLTQVVALQASLMKAGVLVYCPHAHHSHAALAYDLPRGWDFWQEPSFEMLSRCQGMIVYRMPGWTGSQGVQAEIRFATEKNIPIEFVEMEKETFAVDKIRNLSQ